MWSGSSYQTVPFAGATGQWCHVAVVLSPTNAQFFVNGLPLGETTNGINLGVTGAPFTIGAAYNDSGNLSNHFAGKLDEVRVWNVARSRADITNQMFQAATGTDPNLVACYHFDEASGIAAYDATTNRLNGMLVNRPVHVPSLWSPVIRLNSPEPFTNECHVTFLDSTTANGAPVAIAAGAYHSLALRADGSVVGWGDNYYGQTNIPARATSGVVAIAAGGFHSLALKADGSVVGWGRNDAGQVNIPNSATSGVVAIAAGYYYSLALKAEGSVKGWGSNSYGQTNIPTTVTSGVVAIATGGYHGLALKADGSVKSWGRNNSGQTAIPASATGGVVAIVAGGYHSLALKADGSVVGWGSNSCGQTNIPTSATSGVVATAAGDYHGLALKADGSVKGWGAGGPGTSGVYDYGQSTIPAGATNGVVAIAANWDHSLALKADGSVVGWGRYNEGQTAIPASVCRLNLLLAVGGSVNTNVPGIYPLIYYITNMLGNVVTATRTVVVVDTLPPTLTLLGMNSLELYYRSAFVDPGATATDLCAGNLTSAIVVGGRVDSDVLGICELTYTVTDSSGNTISTNRTVRVVQFPSTVAGDLDGNGVVDQAEFDAVARSYWGHTSRPCMTDVVIDGEGLFQLTLTNAAAWNFSMEVSTNLADWDYLSPAWPRLQFSDPHANQPQRYYRLRWP